MILKPLKCDSDANSMFQNILIKEVILGQPNTLINSQEKFICKSNSYL